MINKIRAATRRSGSILQQMFRKREAAFLSLAAIDTCIRTADGSVFVFGWALPARSADLEVHLAGSEPIPISATWVMKRPDLVEPFQPRFGGSVIDGGFLTTFRDAPRKARISIYDRRAKRVLCTKIAETFSSSPTDFGRQFLALPTAAHRLVERISQVELPTIERLLALQHESFVTLPVDRWDFGRPPSNPQVTIVVPLYGRCDFVESQLLAFSMDPAFRNDIELLYVVDDETLVGPMLETASALNNLYDVSFSVIWGHANRGYAEANNLGAGLARARNLILLNSDVFPRAPGWVAKLTAALDAHPEFGVIAPRLLFSDGGIQHAGMVFRHDTQFNVWLNDHPLLGLPPSADTASELTSRPAVTGACMACRRNEFMDLGGFDTGYLIGDFEDSDLCLKYHKVGLKAGYLPTVELTHLERQSFQLAGDPDFRHRVVLLNALRHQRRWGELIRAIMASAKEEIAA